jgi:ATP-binding cassette subfamily B protein
MKNNAFQTIKIYWSHVRRHRAVFFAIIFLAIASNGANSLVPVLMKKIVDSISSSGGRDVLFSAAIGFLLFAAGLEVFRWICFRAIGFTYIKLLARLLAEINNASFRHLHRHSFSFFSDNFSGSLVKKVNYFTRAFENISDNFLWNLIPMITNMIVIVAVLFSRQWQLGLIAFVWLAFFFALNFYFSSWKYKYDVIANEAASKTTGFLADTIANFSSLKLFNGYKRESKDFADLNDSIRKKNVFAWSMEEFFNSISSFLMVVLEVGLLWFTLRLWRAGLLTPGDFVMVQTYVIIIIGQSWQFGKMVRYFFRAFSDAEEMTALLLTDPEIADLPLAKELKVTAGKIEYEKTCFCYHKTRKILGNFNMTIGAGEKIALIGPSGAGKTTVVKLLLRNFDLTAGHIFVDGQDIARVTQESLWRNISLVPQDPALFHRTLRENIAYGRPDASEKEIIKASKLAHCHEFISSLPDGYETYVGERGIKLSGGERQRVAIARAILRNAPILILDEATSSLDSESERLIQDALEKLMAGKTVIIIAHRLSTIRKMDRIIFIDEGEIKEEGTHAVLEKKEGGFYRRLWEMQAGGFVSE